MQVGHGRSPFLVWLARSRAVDVFEQREQSRGVLVGDAVEHRLRFAPGGDQAFLTHLGEMLRQRRLAQAHRVGEVVDRHFARERQAAQDQQPVLVGEQLQQAGGFTCLALQFGNANIGRAFVDGRFVGTAILRKLGIAKLVMLIYKSSPRLNEKRSRVMTATAKPEIRAFFDEPTNTVSYLVWDPATKEGAVIDPVLNFDQRSGEATVESADALLAEAEQLGIKIDQILETHAHADHLSGAPYIKLKTGAKIASASTSATCRGSSGRCSTPWTCRATGSEFDHLFKDGERFKIGTLDGEVIYTPGHTPACVSYKIGDAVFVGDTMFMPDYGTARADFPGGDARELYRSIQRMSVAAARDAAVHVPRLQGAGPRPVRLGDDGRRGEGAQCARARRRERGRVRQDARNARRDAGAPMLLLPSIQVNIRAGKFPPAEANGVRYLKVPVKLAS